jgi:hypothetical protein
MNRCLQVAEGASVLYVGCGRTWRHIERVTAVIEEITRTAPGGPAWIVKALAPMPPDRE